jgi:hypothetical protein
MSNRGGKGGGSRKVPGPHPLTAKAQRFAQEYLVDQNATQAAIRAGYSAATANAKGPELSKDPRIAALIEAGLAAIRERLGVTAERNERNLAEAIDKTMAEIRLCNGDPETLAKLVGALSKLQALAMKFRGQLRDRVDLNVNDWPDMSGLSDEDLASLDRIAEKARKSAGDGGQQHGA